MSQTHSHKWRGQLDACQVACAPCNWRVFCQDLSFYLLCPSYHLKIFSHRHLHLQQKQQHQQTLNMDPTTDTRPLPPNYIMKYDNNYKTHYFVGEYHHLPATESASSFSHSYKSY